VIERYVATEDIRNALNGRATEIINALRIPWDTVGHNQHILCPYTAHDDTHPSWRWDRQRERAICTCSGKGDDALGVLMKIEGVDFNAAKLRAAEILQRHDLIRGTRVPNGGGGPLQRGNGAAHSGCTLDDYAALKKLPVEFLRSLGLDESRNKYGAPRVTIPYFAADGTVAAVHLRIANHGKDKFLWRTGDKTFLYGVDRLDAMRKAGAEITIVEGESDCHSLWYAGLPAIGLPGAGNWNDERDAALLDGFAVINVLVEPDAGGDTVQKWLAKSRIRSRVRLLRLDGFKDVSELWVDIPDPNRFIERWMAALDASVPWAEERTQKNGVALLTGSTVTPVPINWQWNGWLAAGKLHLLAGAKGTKKTTIAIDLAARMTSGSKWPDGTPETTPGDVLLWSGEDDFNDTLLPRFLVAGGDPKRIHFISGMLEEGKRRPFDPARDIPVLIEAARQLLNLRMMIVDSVVSAVAGDSHKNAEVRRGLQPLVAFAAETRCSVLGLTHFTKGTTGRDPVERVTGSLAFAAQARVVLVTAKPAEINGKCRLVRAASNIGPDGGGFEYASGQQLLTGYDFSALRVLWGARLEGPARELLNVVEQPEGGERPAPRRDMATEFLQTILADGPVATNQIRANAVDAGIAWRTVERAAADLGVFTARVGGLGDKGGWQWRLPDDVPPAAQIEL
jgi:putative DNA primase/helicase